jgi:hypothetical protein
LLGWGQVLVSKPDLLREIMKVDIPRSAAVALDVSVEEIKSLGAHPADLLSVTISQWVHNLEIEDIRRCMPMPPADEETTEVEGDPTEDNPLALVEKLASGFHWSFDEACRITMPQMYLLSNSSAWTWHKHDKKRDAEDRGSTNDRPSERKKLSKPIHKMTSKEYREHVREIAHILG